MATARQQIDVVDLLPAQVAGIMYLIQFGIVGLIAYDGAFDLHTTYEAAGFTVSLAFLVNIAAVGVIMITNGVEAEDFMFWEDQSSLDQVYSMAIFGTIALVTIVEFWPWANDFILSSDVAGTAAFLVSVVAIWAMVWIK